MLVRQKKIFYFRQNRWILEFCYFTDKNQSSSVVDSVSFKLFSFYNDQKPFDHASRFAIVASRILSDSFDLQ